MSHRPVQVILPWMVPLAPLALALLVMSWREARRPETPSPSSTRRATPQPLAASRVTGTDLTGPKALPVAPGARIRVCIGSGSSKIWVSSEEVSGSMTLGEDGIPRSITVKVDFATFRREDEQSSRQLSWDILGVHRYGTLTFQGQRDVVLQTTVKGVSRVSFRGWIQAGDSTRQVTIPLWISAMPDNGLRVLGRGTAYGSEFNLPSQRGTIPFTRDEPLVLVWDLRF